MLASLGEDRALGQQFDANVRSASGATMPCVTAAFSMTLKISTTVPCVMTSARDTTMPCVTVTINNYKIRDRRVAQHCHVLRLSLVTV
jgi:hypothetical protein